MFVTVMPVRFRGERVENTHFFSFIVNINRHRRHFLCSPEMIDDQISGNANNPGQEFALFAVLASFKGLDHLKESVLKNILGELLIFNHDNNRREYLSFMAMDQ